MTPGLSSCPGRRCWCPTVDWSPAPTWRDSRRLYLDGEAFTPADVLVDEVLAVCADAAVAAVIPGLGARALARLGFDGTVEMLSDPTGYATGSASRGGVVVTQRTLEEAEVVTTARLGDGQATVVPSRAERPPLIPQAHTFRAGDSGMPTTVLFPTGHVPGSRRLPVLMDPYGGPHGRRVLNSAHAYLASQWFADQGFVVIVCDGRGTAGNGPVWDRRALHDRVGTADDQAAAVRAVAERFPDDLDTTRVGIRGWSFGGYLAALAVLRHPDVFGAAIAGAPTSDERLYDTCYSERYLGDPNVDPDVYDRNSLIPLAPGLTRPLMIIHGLADDNVYRRTRPRPVRGAPGRRPAPRVPAADRHDPHGQRRSRRREPAPPPSRLPPPLPRPGVRAPHRGAKTYTPGRVVTSDRRA